MIYISINTAKSFNKIWVTKTTNVGKGEKTKKKKIRQIRKLYINSDLFIVCLWEKKKFQENENKNTKIIYLLYINNKSFE